MNAVWFAVFLIPFCIVWVALKACISPSLSSSLCSHVIPVSPSPLFPFSPSRLCPPFPFCLPSPVWSRVAAISHTVYSVSLGPYGFDHLIIERQCPLFMFKVDINIFIENQSNSLTLWILCCYKWQKRLFAKCSHFRGFITFKKERVQVKIKLTDLLKGMFLHIRKCFPF